ncbi:MAG: four helix bundle protein [Chloroflexota bacterium]|nr:four helix bundle protein [Chloroflexota bacterium]
MQKPIHQLVLRFPDYEKFDLANQMRRACKSVPANIAEGYARRRSPKEFCSFLAVATGSANEMEVHLKTAFELDYIAQPEFEHFVGEYQIIGKQLTKLIQYWRSQEKPITSNQSPGD